MKKYLILLIVLMTAYNNYAQEYSYRGEEVNPLRTNYYYDAEDNVTNIKDGKVQDYNSNQKQYRYGKFEGFVFPDNSKYEKDIKLSLLTIYYDSKSKDYVLVSPETEHHAIGDGSSYEFVENIGYIYKNKEANTIPLKLYWSKERKDYYTVALSEGINNAKKGGYQEIGIVGYVLSAAVVSVFYQGYEMTPLYTNYYSESEDNVTNTEGGKVNGRDNQKQYQYSEPEGYIISGIDGESYDKSKIAELCLYYNESNDDYETIVRDQNWFPEDNSTKFIKVMGYVFLGPQPNTVQLISFWSQKRKDYYLTALDSGAKNAKDAGYEEMIRKGYILTLK